MNREKRAALPAAILVTLLWAGSYIVNKIAFAEGIAPLTLSGLRYTLGGLLLAVVLRGKREGKPLPWKNTIWQGILCYVIGQGLQCVGQSFLTPTLSSLVLNASMTIFVLLTDVFLSRELPARRATFWVLLMIASMILYRRPWAENAGEISATGVAIMGIAGFGAAMNLCIPRYMLAKRGIDHTSLTLRPMLCGGVMMLIIGCIQDGLPHFSGRLAFCVLYLSGVSGALGFGLWVWTQKYLTATQSGAINNATMIEIAVLDMLLFHNRPLAVQWIGLAVMFLSITALQLIRRPDELSAKTPRS